MSDRTTPAKVPARPVEPSNHFPREGRWVVSPGSQPSSRLVRVTSLPALPPSPQQTGYFAQSPQQPGYYPASPQQQHYIYHQLSAQQANYPAPRVLPPFVFAPMHPRGPHGSGAGHAGAAGSSPVMRRTLSVATLSESESRGRPPGAAVNGAAEPDTAGSSDDLDPPGRGRGGGRAKDRQPCAFFLKTGSCAYGDRCKFDHPRGRAPHVVYNSLGLPLRPAEPECSHYLKHLSCAFGHTCRYNHPEPSAAMVYMPPGVQYPPLQYPAQFQHVPMPYYQVGYSVAVPHAASAPVLHSPAGRAPAAPMSRHASAPRLQLLRTSLGQGSE